MVRSVKNVTKGYSSVEVKVRNATSNDAWGPVGSDMAEIAQMTFNTGQDFHQIMDMLDKRMNDKGKNWRHVLKALKVLDYCLHEGSELVCTWARNNVYIIKTLREFQYIDEDGRDVGQNVRVSAKELTSLILDEERLRLERTDRKTWKSRVTGIEDYPSPHTEPRPRQREHRRQRADEDDLEYRLAIEASKNEAEEDRKRRERANGNLEDDDDLAKAIKLSKEEEELRRRELEETNASALFDEPLDQPAIAQPTGYNQGYQQQGAVDWYGNLVDQQQQPQNTGFLNSAYSQPPGIQPQQTNYQTGFGYGYQQQQQPQQQPQQSFMQPQQTAFNISNPYGPPQPDTFAEQQTAAQQQSTLSPGSNNPWASPNTNESVKPQPTGSNNPFASSFGRPTPTPSNRPPTLDSLAEQKTQSQFNNSNFNPPVSFTTPRPSLPTQQSLPVQQPLQLPPQKDLNPHHAQLNALLASGEGQDTFGNTGELRIPAQHTAPGTFVNSAGAGAGRLTGNATGNNPFLSSQFTGMPQSTGFGISGHQGGMMPAQTGPAGVSGNPFGAANRPSQGPNTGSLIDL